MNFIQFIKDNLPTTYHLEIYNELSYVFTADVDNVVVKAQQGSRYQRGVVIPISILITSKDVNNALTVWGQWVAEISDRDYNEGTDNYYMIFSTPTVTQVFDENSNNFYGVISVFGTIVETNNALDIKALAIDGVNVIVNEGALVLSNGMNSEAVSGLYLNKSNVINGTLSFQVTTFIEDNTLFDKLRSMRLGTTSINSVFSVKFTWSNDYVEIYTFKLSSQSFNKSRGNISTLTLMFTL